MNPVQRMTWDEICTNEALRGRWIAMSDCSFDDATGRTTAGLVVDADDDLAELCSRIRDSEWKNCSIVLVDDSGKPAAPRPRPRLN
jgi:hypothetical protein